MYCTHNLQKDKYNKYSLLRISIISVVYFVFGKKGMSKKLQKNNVKSCRYKKLKYNLANTKCLDENYYANVLIIAM